MILGVCIPMWRDPALLFETLASVTDLPGRIVIIVADGVFRDRPDENEIDRYKQKKSPHPMIDCFIPASPQPFPSQATKRQLLLETAKDVGCNFALFLDTDTRAIVGPSLTETHLAELLHEEIDVGYTWYYRPDINAGFGHAVIVRCGDDLSLKEPHDFAPTRNGLTYNAIAQNIRPEYAHRTVCFSRPALWIEHNIHTRPRDEIARKCLYYIKRKGYLRGIDPNY